MHETAKWSFTGYIGDIKNNLTTNYINLRHLIQMAIISMHTCT